MINNNNILWNLPFITMDMSKPVICVLILMFTHYP